MPKWVDDDVDEHNPLRVVEAFVDELELAALGLAEKILPEFPDF